MLAPTSKRRAVRGAGLVTLGRVGTMDYGAVIEKLTSWGRREHAVRVMVLSGSAAAHESHPLSDRDVEIYTTEPARLLEDES